jgi:hypothetical protein
MQMKTDHMEHYTLHSQDWAFMQMKVDHMEHYTLHSQDWAF